MRHNFSFVPRVPQHAIPHAGLRGTRPWVNLDPTVLFL